MNEIIWYLIIAAFMTSAVAVVVRREKLTDRREQAVAAEQRAEQAEALWLDWATWCEQQEAGQ